jgi:hypothetical protein
MLIQIENRTVLTIKAIHLTLFILMIISLFYTLYCAIAGVYNLLLLAAMIMIIIDGLSIALSKGRCPLTILAERHGAKNGAVTHLIVGKWAARYVFKFFIVLFIVELIWLGIGYFTG